MKKQILYIVFSLLFGNNVLAQYGHVCGNDACFVVEEESPKGNCHRTTLTAINTEDFHFLQQLYIPNDITPLKTIKVNVNIWRKNDGSGNRWLDTPEYRDTLQLLFQYLNDLYAANDSFSDPVFGSQYIPDAKVRFEIANFYYYDDSIMAYNLSFYNFELYQQQHYPDRLSNFNFHLTLNNMVGYSGISSSYNSRYQSIIMPKQGLNDPHHLWAMSMLLAHEFGHNFGLGHPYNSEITQISHPEFLWDLFGGETQSWCSRPPEYVCFQDGGWGYDPWDSTNTSTNNLMGGTSSGRHITALQCGRIHRALSLSSLRNYTYGYSEIPYIISKNQTWDYNPKFYQDIIIEPGVTLTILCTVEMVPEAKIIIRPGAKLIIDAGKITNAENQGHFWQGIIVLGDSAQGQLDSKQGVIELKNGAVIENALTGVLVGSPENENSKNGGIIRANNANFINCPTGVVIKPYMRILQYGDERGNLSSFTSCTFIWNKEMNNVQNGLRPKPLSHVVLTETGNISFKGCHFINQRFSDRVTHGIYATDAKFEVNAIVAPNVYPPEIIERSSFDTLIYGIRTEKTIPSINRFATVKYTDFNNNTISILNNGVNNSVFHNNTFKIGNPPGIIFAPNDPYTYKEEQHAKSLVPIFNFEFGTGITLNQSTGYDVRFNDFNRVQTPVYRPIGILVKNSGQAPNEIKNNTFDSLHIAILCNGNNKSTIAPYAGLQLLCNVFGDQTEYAIQIDNTGNGIAQYQGQNTRSAGNSFQQNNPKEFGHILNQSGDLTGYFYNIGHTASVPAKISSDIALFPITTSNSCLSSSSQEYSHEKLAMAKSIFASIKYNYNNLIDGGSTDQLLTELELSWSKDAWQVRDELIQKSPYLSETVIREVAAKDILPHAMLLEVCIANPDATRDRKFIHFLRYEIPNPIPEYMCDLIIANQDAKTFRTALEASLTAAESNLEIISRNILAQYFEDTLGNAIDSAIYILEHIPNIEASLELADLYAFSGDFSKALDLLEALEEDILKEQEVAELNTLELWYTIMDDWLLNNRTSLTENELQMMIELFLDNENKVSERTKSIFYQHSACDYNYHIEPNIPNSGKPKIMKQNVNAAVSDRNKVTVQPNPAGSFTTFNYELQPDANDAALLITDSKGVSLLSVSLADAKGHYLWDTRGISSGVYLYTVMYNGQILNSGKVVVKK